jgi:hypothetical protein
MKNAAGGGPEALEAYVGMLASVESERSVRVGDR